eukprot:NODE_595_length_6292_cov_0.230906.p2 type:complete len:367 gc:universal NODE_595_length_6292_cov_0.230906:1899-2999(+)
MRFLFLILLEVMSMTPEQVNNMNLDHELGNKVQQVNDLLKSMEKPERHDFWGFSEKRLEHTFWELEKEYLNSGKNEASVIRKLQLLRSDGFDMNQLVEKHARQYEILLNEIGILGKEIERPENPIYGEQVQKLEKEKKMESEKKVLELLKSGKVPSKELKKVLGDTWTSAEILENKIKEFNKLLGETKRLPLLFERQERDGTLLQKMEMSKVDLEGAVKKEKDKKNLSIRDRYKLNQLIESTLWQKFKKMLNGLVETARNWKRNTKVRIAEYKHLYAAQKLRGPLKDPVQYINDLNAATAKIEETKKLLENQRKAAGDSSRFKKIHDKITESRPGKAAAGVKAYIQRQWNSAFPPSHKPAPKPVGA